MSGNKVIGFAMSPDELPFINDIFSSLDEETDKLCVTVFGGI